MYYRKFVYYFGIAILLLLVSCSVKNNYRALSFFFDGVPHPTDSTDLVIPIIDISSDSSLTELDSTGIFKNQITYHYPYRYRGCSSCHDSKSVGEMIYSEPELCYQCHTNYTDDSKHIHGPVEGGFCTPCHDPHSSKDKKLLKMPGNDMCKYCHSSGNISKIQAHEIKDGDSCIDCHDPHSADNKELLRK